MSTKNAVNAQTMGSRKDEGGKNWTKQEMQARAQAAAEFARADPVKLRVPSWLPKPAKKVWRKVIKDSAEIKLYDYLDADTLAIYCHALAAYHGLAESPEKKTNDDLRLMQSQAKMILQYAEKLGLTPQSRARLVKRRADEIIDDFGAEFD